MAEFVSPFGQEGWLNGVYGTVVDTKKWSETHVSSSGGGGYVHPKHGGLVRAAQVHSTVETKGELWIKTAAGKEVQIFGDIPARPGHRVGVIWGGPKGKKGSDIYWINETTNKHDIIRSQIVNDFIEKKSEKESWWFRFAFIMLFPIVVFFIYGQEPTILGRVVVSLMSGVLTGLCILFFLFRLRNIIPILSLGNKTQMKRIEILRDEIEKYFHKNKNNLLG